MSRRIVALLFALLTGSGALAQSEDFGKWKSLFNGKDVSGWITAKKNHGENVWKVEDSALTNGKDGANDLCTVEEFRDYELEIEYRIPKRGNSGVYLRGQIEIQIFDSAGKEKLSSADAGAIYGGNFVALRNAQKPAGEWNKYRVLHVGHRITVWHNGVLIQDNIYAGNPTGGAMKVHPTTGRKLNTAEGPVAGPLMLQGDHSRVWYRNIRIRPLFQDGSGWRPLWNGEDLSAFRARGREIESGWKVADHALLNHKWGGGGGFDIWTKESFGNFLVYYAYRSDKNIEGGNSGFYLRDQWEIQIFRDASSHPRRGRHRDGALYSLYSPLVAARHAPEEWNHVFVKLDGMKIWAWQNGKLIHDGRVCATRTDNHSVPTTKFSRAPFKIQGDHGKVAFSNIWIKELPDTPAAD